MAGMADLAEPALEELRSEQPSYAEGAYGCALEAWWPQISRPGPLLGTSSEMCHDRTLLPSLCSGTSLGSSVICQRIFEV